MTEPSRRFVCGAGCPACGGLSARLSARSQRSEPSRENPVAACRHAGQAVQPAPRREGARGSTQKSVRHAIALALAVGAALAFQPATAPEHRPLDLPSPLQDKNFYLLSLLERDAAAREAVRQDAVLAEMAASRRSALDAAGTKCGADLECNAATFTWSEAQIELGARALAALSRTSPAVRALADGPLRASGMYVRDRDDLLQHAWTECLQGIDRAIGVYALGKPPRYPAIDSITYDPKADAYRHVVQHLVAVLEDDRASLDLAWSASLRFALEVMFLNHRDEAARFEPMEKGENAAAYRRARSVDWSRYPYTAIVVPGAGGDRPGIRLSPGGKLRDEIAAKRYREGKAPFLIVSGGFVHPSQTGFSEAIEMKRDLMTRFGIPEEAILVDPHARHTTTNLRNAARLMYRYGFPFERKALVTTDPSQSASIENPNFARRCIDELGYVPHRLLGRTSPFDLEFVPLPDSLQSDPKDPLDP